MKKLALIVLFVFAPLMTKAQIVVNSKFKPRSFNEYMAPYMMYKDAYNAATQKFESYFEKENIELAKYQNKEHYSPSLGLFYINKCIEINNRFEGNMCDRGYLYYRKGIWHLLNNEENEAKKILLQAWQEYKNEPARDLYNHIVTK